MMVMEQGLLQLIQPITIFTKKKPVHLAPIALTVDCETKLRAILILAAQDLTKAVEQLVLGIYLLVMIRPVVYQLKLALKENKLEKVVKVEVSMLLIVLRVLQVLVPIKNLLMQAQSAVQRHQLKLALKENKLEKVVKVKVSMLLIVLLVLQVLVPIKNLLMQTQSAVQIVVTVLVAAVIIMPVKHAGINLEPPETPGFMQVEAKLVPNWQQMVSVVSLAMTFTMVVLH
jgi:hypothetical protein